MNPENSPSVPRRPTILVGYGAFGLEVFRRLLSDAALRGALDWQELGGSDGTHPRRLRHLSLVWVPDVIGLPEQQVSEGALVGDPHHEILRDLYRQIRRVESGAEVAAALTDTLLGEASVLLSARHRALDPAGRSPLGLDVIAVARPTHERVIGTLDGLLAPGMNALRATLGTEATIHGTEALHFLSILDFDGYWAESERARVIREALAASVRLWVDEAARHLPAFRRIYLTDLHTREGVRDRNHRLDEVCLFLELLLFEGQRGELQRLYQPRTPDESPVATFGVRLLERGTEQLRRLAGAYFGWRWLDHLSGVAGRRAVEPRPTAVLGALEQVRPAVLDQSLEATQLRELEVELLSGSLESSGWADRQTSLAAKRVAELEARLSEMAATRLADLSRGRLASFADDLRGAIDTDLHHGSDPASLGAVLEALEVTSRELSLPAAILETSAATAGYRGGDPFGELEKRYRTFRERRVVPEKLARFWPWFGAMMAAGAVPLVADLAIDTVAYLAPADPVSSPPWRRQLHELLGHLCHPLVLGLAVLASAATGLKRVQRGIRARLESAAAAFDDADRGRRGDRVRAALGRDGWVGRRVHRFADELVRDLAVALRSSVRRELGTLVARLKERRREMDWLREQLRDFLQLHGIHPTTDDRIPDRTRMSTTGIRQNVERPGDLERILRTETPSPARFRSAQGELGPFGGWHERFCPAFLYPLQFIERLAARYEDPFTQELTQVTGGGGQQTWAKEVKAFLRGQQRGAFDLAFSVKVRKGQAVEERICVCPRSWLGLPGVRDEVREHGLAADRVLPGHDPSRLYLLQLQLGIDPGSLERIP